MKPATNIPTEYLQEKVAALRVLCQKHKVKKLWAIGSVLTRDFNENSDVDLLYEFDRPAIPDDLYLNNLDGLIRKLSALFTGRKIDLIHYPSLKNPFFIEEIEETKVLLYDKDRQEVSV
ncbi:MAG: nucleotidyltransferase domain-containing protein [Bacteroidota bacterium]